MFSTKNRELKEKIKKFEETQEELIQETTKAKMQVIAKDKLIKQLNEKSYKNDQELQQLKNENKKLKDSAIEYNKNELVINSLKILGSVLKDEEPKKEWFQHQFDARNRLDALQRGFTNPFYDVRNSQSGLLENLFGL